MRLVRDGQQFQIKAVTATSLIIFGAHNDVNILSLLSIDLKKKLQKKKCRNGIVVPNQVLKTVTLVSAREIGHLGVATTRLWTTLMQCTRTFSTIGPTPTSLGMSSHLVEKKSMGG